MRRLIVSTTKERMRGYFKHRKMNMIIKMLMIKNMNLQIYDLQQKVALQLALFSCKCIKLKEKYCNYYYNASILFLDKPLISDNSQMELEKIKLY